MTILEIILSILTTLFGGGSIFSTVMFFKQNKQLKKIEVEKAKASVETDKVDNDIKLSELTKILLDNCEENSKEYQKQLEEKDKKFDEYVNEKNGMIKELNAQLLQLQKDYNQLQLENQSLNFCKCTRFNCLNRIPPSKVFGDDTSLEPIVVNKEDYLNR